MPKIPMLSDILALAKCPPAPDGSFLDEGTPVTIYGAGNVGRELHRILSARGVGVRCFLDRNASPGSHVQGIPAYRTEEAPLTAAERHACPVIIAVFNRDVDVASISARLTALGFGRVVTFVDLHSALPPGLLGDRFWLTARSFYATQLEAIRECNGLWADDSSRALYRALLYFRLTGDYRALPDPDRDNQYVPSDVPPWPGPVRFVDGGAYDGSTLCELLRHRVRLEAVAAFEPDLANFAMLAGLATGELAQRVRECYLWPCAPHSTTGLLRFMGGQGEGSYVADHGEQVVQAVSLDAVLPTFRPTLIRLDVEGAECEALDGARNLVARHCPGLAVCVYHRPDHLWRVPLLVGAWRCGYRFFLRSHGHNAFDVVMYAQPAGDSVGRQT